MGNYEIEVKENIYYCETKSGDLLKDEWGSSEVPEIREVKQDPHYNPKNPFREKVNCNHIMLTREKNNNNILM